MAILRKGRSEMALLAVLVRDSAERWDFNSLQFSRACTRPLSTVLFIYLCTPPPPFGAWGQGWGRHPPSDLTSPSADTVEAI